jgi:predicted heme/steroid binding protein
MNKKLVLAVLIAVFVLFMIYFVRISQDSSGEVLAVNNGELSGSALPINSESAGEQIVDVDPAVEEPVEDTKVATGIPLSFLNLHNTGVDCWVAYDGKVYDISSYLPAHPGSASRIKPFCGTSDGFTNAFERQHGTSKVSLLMKVGVFMGDFDVIGDLA